MKTTEKTLAIVHFIILSGLIWWNYYTNTGAIDGKTVGSVSNQYHNLFTPAGYAFAIWGIIYLGLIVLAVYMLLSAFSKTSNSSFITKSAPTLILAHLGNATWLWFWLQEQSGITVFIMFFILGSLIATVLRLDMQRWDAPFKFIILVWWPIDLYLGWISVATIANFSAHLGSIGWTGGLSEVTWTILTVSLATILAIFMIFNRNMREFGGVVIWALVAIAVRHWDSIPSLQWSAVIGASTIGLASITHAYQKRSTLPLIRKD